MTVIYCLSVVVMTYEMSYKIAGTKWFHLLFSAVLVAGICKYHASLQQVIMVQLVLLTAFLVLITVPFFLGALSGSELMNPSASRALRLIRPLSEDHVIAEFLKSEFEKASYRQFHDSLRDIIFNPNLDDQAQCATRRTLLALRHRALWRELPQDTQWYEAQIDAADFHRVRVFPRAQWARIARGNFAITKVAERIRNYRQTAEDPFVGKISDIREDLSQDLLIAGSVILIGSTESDSLTILDGNHRFVAGILEGKVDRLRFVCGLSTNMTRCCWYKTNLFNLARYGRNLVLHFFEKPSPESANFPDGLKPPAKNSLLATASKFTSLAL